MINIAPWKAISIFCVVSLYVVTPASGADVTIQWYANVEPDLLGYKLYYHAGPSAPPYTGSDAIEGDSPIVVYAGDITVDDICRYTLSGLQDTESYYFAVSAFDTQGNESDYSGEACFNCEDDSVGVHFNALDSGGGGGCLISTATHGQSS